jgi:hypothetical protein
VDFSKAFDYLSFEAIIGEMAILKMSPVLIRWVDNWLRGGQ